MVTKHESDEIRQQMSRVRRDLDEDVGAVVENAKELTDWRGFVKRHPVLTVSMAAALGYFVVPRRLNLVSPSPEVLEQLAEKNRLVVKPKADVRRQAKMTSPLVNFIVGAAMRSAMTFAGQRLGGMVSSDSASRTTNGVAQS